MLPRLVAVKKCILCHYLLFNHGFQFRDSVCNSCHDLTILCLNISVLLSPLLKVPMLYFCGMVKHELRDTSCEL